MKKILFSLVLVALVSITASSQSTLRRHHRGRTEITRLEAFQIHRDMARNRIARRHALGDGVVTPYEKRRLIRMRVRTAADAYRYRHNGRKRLI